MTKSKTKRRKEVYSDSWMYILLLTTLVILIESLKSYTFTINQVSVTYSIFLLPIIYLITNYITKKYDYKKSIVAISISGVSLVLFVAIMNFALGKTMDFSSVSGQFCGYVVSQFVNLTIYKFLLNNTNSPFFLIFLNYLFSLIVFYMFYTLIHLNMIILDDFWTGYFMVLDIQTVICFILSIIDSKIRIGIKQ